VRKATTEQAKTAGEIAQAAGFVRRGAATTARALSEQTTAGEQISRGAGELQRLAASLATAVKDQAKVTGDVATAADGMRVQSEQAARAVKEQARTMRDMIVSAQSTAKQIKLITKANIEHSTVSSSLLRSVSEIRQITDRNANGVKETRGGTDDLLRRAQALVALVERPGQARPNGRAQRGQR
jgi:methyl-accepting chemotaxis protein